MTSDLLVAVRTVLAVAFAGDTDDYDDAYTATVSAFRTAEDAQTRGEGFLSVVAALAVGIGEASAAGRPSLAAVLIRILETVAVYRVRERIIDAAMAGLDDELAETPR